MIRRESESLVLLAGDRHQIPKDQDSFGTAKHGLKDVGLGDITTSGFERARWANAEAAAVFGIEQRGKNSRTIKAGEHNQSTEP